MYEQVPKAPTSSSSRTTGKKKKKIQNSKKIKFKKTNEQNNGINCPIIELATGVIVNRYLAMVSFLVRDI